MWPWDRSGGRKQGEGPTTRTITGDALLADVADGLRSRGGQNHSEMVNEPKLTVPQRRRALLSVDEVAALLQVPVSWVYDRTRARGLNRIPGFRLGKYWRFEESEILAWLEQQRAGSRGNV
jgi:excisionase family DNA binding protein